MLVKMSRFLKEYIILNIFKKRRKPRVLQLPITNRCNSRCIICNVWKNKEKNDIDAKDLKKALQDPFFEEVRVVGINGGEPFLHNNIIEVVEAVLSLKRVQVIYFITNGLLPELISCKLDKISRLCKDKGVLVDVTVSIDSVGVSNDFIRGVHDSYNKSINTLELLKRNAKLKAMAGCTIGRANISEIFKLDSVLKQKNITVHYHLAVPVKRIGTFDQFNEAYIFADKRAKMLARETFFGQFKYSSDLKNGLRAFMSYYYLISGCRKRLATCTYLRQDITIDEQLNLYLCATASEKIGSLRTTSATDIMSSQSLVKEQKRLEAECKNCIHYATHPTLECIYLFIKEKLKPGVWLIYKLRLLFRII